jgi:hypothetical protein
MFTTTMCCVRCGEVARALTVSQDGVCRACLASTPVAELSPGDVFQIHGQLFRVDWFDVLLGVTVVRVTGQLGGGVIHAAFRFAPRSSLQVLGATVPGSC